MPADFDDICNELEQAKKDIEALNKAEGELAGVNEGLATTFHDLSKEIANAVSNNEAVKLSAAQAMKELEKLEKVNKELAGATMDVGDEMEELVDFLEAQSKASKKTKKANKELEKSQDAVKLSVKEALKEIDKLDKSLDKSSKASKDNVKVNKELAGAMGGMSSVIINAAADIDELGSSYDDTSESSGSFSEEIEKQASILGLLKDKLSDGEKELKSFGDGLGDNATKGAVATAALVFLIGKIKELGQAINDTVIDYSKFNIELSKATKSTLIAPGGVKQLQSIQDELGLVNEDFGKFIDIAIEGARSGVASLSELTEASRKLQETFGGEQIELLREYVELLEQIPTLETDLTITASLDNQASAVFDLIQSGKLEKAFELQQAGLLGGAGGANVGTERDVDLLNAEKDIKKLEEDSLKLAAGYYPIAGPALTSIADNTLKLLESGASLFIVVGGVKFAIDKMRAKATLENNKLLAEQKSTTQAIRTPSAKGGTGGGIGGSKGLATKLGGVAIGLSVFSSVLDGVGDKLVDNGDKISGGFAQAGSAVADLGSAALTGAAIGSIFPVVGTAAGAVIGGLFGLVSNLDNFGKAIDNITDGLTEEEKIISKLTDSEIEFMLSFKDSALTLQTLMKQIEQSVNSASIKFLDLAIDIDKSNLDTLSRTGESIGEFSNGIDKVTKDVQKRFLELNKSLNERRMDILKDSSLNAQDRKTALQELKKAELDATNKFLDGMDDINERLSRTPLIIENNLKKEFAKLKLDTLLEAGGGEVGLGDLSKAIGDKFTRSIIEASAVFSSLGDKVDLLNSELESLEKSNEQNAKSLEETFKKLPRDVQNAVNEFRGAGGDEAKLTELKKGGAKIEGELSGTESVKLSDKRIKLARETKNLNQTLNKIDDEIDDLKIKENLNDKERIKLAEDKKKSVAIRGRIIDIGNEESEINKSLEKFTKEEVEIAKSRAVELRKQLTINGQAIGFLEARNKIQKKSLEILKKRLAIQSEARQKFTEVVNGIDDINKLLESGEVKGAERRLDVLESLTAFESAIGNSTKNSASIMEENNKLIEAQLNASKLAEKRVKDFGKELKRAEEEFLDIAKKGGDTAGAQKLIEAARTKLAQAESNAQKSRARALEAATSFSEKFNTALDNVKKSFQFRTSGGGIDLGETQIELNEFGGAISQIAESRKLIVDSAEKQFNIEKKSIQEIAKATLSQIENAKGITAQQKEQQKALVSRESEVKLAENELKFKKQVVDASKKERDFKANLLDMDQESLDEQISFLQEIGGSYGQIFELQKQGIGIERQKLELAEENLAQVKAAGIEGPALRRAELDVQKQGFSLQKKALGAQRDAFEKIVGMAFGALRQSRGARRGVLSDASTFGRGFVQGAGTGLISSGGAKTLQSRRNAFQLGGIGQAGKGATRANFEALGGKPGQKGFKSDSKGDKKTIFGGKDRFAKAPLTPAGKGDTGTQIATINTPGGMKITIDNKVSGEATITINPDKITKEKITLLAAKTNKTQKDLETKAVSRKL